MGHISTCQTGQAPILISLSASAFIWYHKSHSITMFRLCLAVFASLVVLGQCQDNGQEVAFSAGLSHHEYLQANTKVKYDTIFTNVGGGYDSTTGIFTCPTPGLYVFQFHALSHSTSQMWLELHHNYNYVASIYGHVDNDYAAGGNSVILRLAKNDQVYILTTDASDLYGQPAEVYGTFSGYLISGVYEEFNVVG